MARRAADRRPMSQSAVENLEVEISRIASLNIDQLRVLWRDTTGRPAPDFLSKELIARALAYRLQEQRLGGLDPHLHRLLISLEKPRGRADPPPKNRLGHSPGVRRQDPRGHGRARRVLLVGTDLRQPVGDCAQDHRHELERAPLLWPARQGRAGAG